MTTTNTRFSAVSSTARLSFAGLAAVVTLAVLGSVTQIAGAQVKEAQLAQARSDAALVAMAHQADAAPVQIVVVTGKRA
ncbi:MAG TPA: hypothetical protein VLA61_09745 [Ideonella sp.]|uniref:hypothetical protein n=1 Tax=Ideonella sp. TaxID=1929293 RepID=UPI002B704918|nr:hypothetical protein [Ideonella sp.]HSI48541.1 hypothetical protein [Ideonella sp.]